ncbi:uncharacterized protein LOC114977826 [Acropora millepora]|uniref:uncharacterized protein LOC114977826 n=1 Tax=Acropora millepora TaxID=45264 RepID=UPI001CF47E0D|nr:uncharacterized protein LOC114977826 [Acropora millepora]
MASKNLKSVLFLMVVFLDCGHLRDSVAVECRFKRDCNDGEYCDEYTQLCRRDLIEQSDFRSYNRGADRQRTRDDDYFVTKDYYQYDNSNGVTSGQPDNSDWFVEKSGPMEEYQNLRDDLPVHDAGHNRRGHNNGGALPPSNTENWDKTNYVKHGLERGSNENLVRNLKIILRVSLMIINISLKANNIYNRIPGITFLIVLVIKGNPCKLDIMF